MHLSDDSAVWQSSLVRCSTKLVILILEKFYSLVRDLNLKKKKKKYSDGGQRSFVP